VATGVTTRPTTGAAWIGKRQRRLLQDRSPSEVKNIATGHPVAPKAKRAQPSAEQRDVGAGWNHVDRGCLVVKENTLTPNPNPKPVTEVPKQPTLTTTTKQTVKPKNHAPKTTAAFKSATENPKKKGTTDVKTMANNPKTTNLVVTTHTTTSPLDDISDSYTTADLF